MKYERSVGTLDAAVYSPKPGSRRGTPAGRASAALVLRIHQNGEPGASTCSFKSTAGGPGAAKLTGDAASGRSFPIAWSGPPRQVLPFIRVLPDVVKFLPTVRITDAAPVLIDDRILVGLHSGKIWKVPDYCAVPPRAVAPHPAQGPSTPTGRPGESPPAGPRVSNAPPCRRDSD